jgi:hypothetical protein
MKAIIQNTDQIIEVNGVEGRVWMGTTEAGIECEFLVTRVAVREDQDASEFEHELQEMPPVPFVSQIFPLKLIL